MAQKGTARSRQQGLQQAASVVFALVGIVPLLVFAFTLWQIGVIHRTLAQATLLLTLALMLLGFWLFRSMLREMSGIVGALVRAVEQTGRAPAGAPPPGGAAAPAAPARADPARERQVAGFGAIFELGEMARTMDLIWQREASRHVGRRVQISVAHSQELEGRLVEASDAGVILEQDGGRVAIIYRRVQGIEPLVGG